MAAGGPSAWVLSPERSFTIEKEQFDEFDEIPPFRPELASDAAVRQRVRSSGYGRKTASPPKRVEIQDGVRPWEEKPTFKPNLTFNEESEKLRKNARSSGYGKSVVNNKPKPEPERPNFKPSLTKSPVAKQLREKAASSGYGTVLAQSPKPKEPELPSFKPKIPKTKAYLAAQSSKYGKVVPPTRPSTAPARSGNFENIFHPEYERVTRHTLLQDKPDPTDSDDEDNEIKQREKKFVLDGVTCAANYNADLMYRRASREALLPPPVKKTELSLKIHRNAQSSKYGDVIPERYIGQRPQTADAIPSFRFDKKSALDEELPPSAPKTPLADKVGGTGYNSDEYVPMRGQKAEPIPEPSWAPTLQRSPGVPGVDQMAPAPVNKLNEQVASHGYGTVAPERGPMVEVVPEPVWVPPHFRPKPIPQPPPPPRSSQYDHIGSHYGPNYVPPRPIYSDEEEEDADYRFSSSQHYEEINGNGHVDDADDGEGAAEDEEMEAY